MPLTTAMMQAPMVWKTDLICKGETVRFKSEKRSSKGGRQRQGEIEVDKRKHESVKGTGWRDGNQDDLESLVLAYCLLQLFELRCVTMKRKTRRVEALRHIAVAHIIRPPCNPHG